MNNSKIFIIEGIDVYNYYDSDYYGMSAYIFRYTNHGKNFLFTLPGCYFEEILKNPNLGNLGRLFFAE
ncbi:hypothetical protein B0681_10235 [Moraxella porci DSM 25326]|uniref:Uncharacterized protein n=1 Tax=Moraxella porci DSM 25326 TaxID=573983 RepID=A0A1T0CKT7_9GAMM|nr:hypothetical protein B0681_10235 [Moraxella porci DSM 25326]